MTEHQPTGHKPTTSEELDMLLKLTALGDKTAAKELRMRVLMLAEAAALVYHSLNARLGDATTKTRPVFEGLAELHAALSEGDRWPTNSR